MKKLLGAASALAILGLAAPAFAADNASASASANIITPLAVTATGALNFGNILQETSAFNVTVDSSGGRTGTGPTGSLLLGSTPSVPTFHTVTDGTGGTHYGVTVANSSVTDGTHTMTVDTFSYSTTNTHLSGNSDIAVGATLHVGANQATGVYTGTITATAAYE